jgi:hypothetical protein
MEPTKDAAAPVAPDATKEAEAKNEQPEANEPDLESILLAEADDAIDDGAKEEEAAPESGEKKPEPKAEGTPDKALQRMQQDLAATTRKLDELTEKLSSGETLTDKEKAQVLQHKRRIDDLKQTLTGDTYDPFDEQTNRAAHEALIETDKEVQTLREEVKQLKESHRASSNDATWGTVKEKYAGVDVTAVWNKAIEDAQSYARFGQEAYQQRASDLFHERCDAAKKQLASRAEAAAKNKTAAKADSPATTKGGGKLAVSAAEARSGAASLSEEQQYTQRAMDLLLQKD